MLRKSIACTDDFNELLENCSKVFGVSCSAFIRLCVFSFLDSKIQKGNYSEKLESAWNEYNTRK